MTYSGTITSDYLKFANVEESDKNSLIDYSNTDFYGYKNSLINYIKAVYPLDYNNFIESDLGIMLVELFAYIGATTSLKADLLANENFIRTARSRNNVKNLLELIGIRMKGPIASVADALVTFSDTPFENISDRLEISTQNRVVQITSPEDGAPLNFTLYKVVNGVIEDLNSDANIILNATEADNYTGMADSATVFSNLVLVEGALVKQSGQFNSNQGVKLVELNRAPVIEGSIQVFIDGDSDTSGAYRQLDNIFFASGSSDKAFQVTTDDDFKATIAFGDNIVAKSPRVGDTYTILYRVGGGTRGNIANEVINVQMQYENIDGLILSPPTAILENVTQAYGGSNAETVDHAKKYAPLAFRTQDRLVTLQDFKAFTNTFISSFGTVGKGTAATRRAYSSANIIDLFILEKASDLQLKKATPSFKSELLAAIESKKMLTDEIVVVDGLIRTLDLVITVKMDRRYRNIEESIKLNIRDKVLDYFYVDNMDFEKPFILSEFTRSLYDIPELRSITIDNLDGDVYVDFNEILQLNNLTINIELL